ncbi:phosphotransacetylase family protein [Candidatus Bathyarchaeota archaeon]|nr:phosphotransacetylase family protein [Candidatus Bathyarchaeota archaeon]
MDEDVEFMKKLLNLKEENKIICPIVLSEADFLKSFIGRNLKEYEEKIYASFKEISIEKDVILIEGGHTLSTGAFINLCAPKLAKAFSSKFILVHQFKGDFLIDEAVQAKDYCLKWGLKPYGIILNKVPQEKIDFANTVIKNFLNMHDLELLGVIPENSILNSLTVKEIYEKIDGKILAGEEGINNLVQTFLVGAMSVESSMKYFRKTTNKLIITGGDRTDLILAALETKASGIILTGNLYPSIKVFPKADELKIPLILVSYDTFTTLQLLQKIIGKTKLIDEERIKIAKQIFEENISWKRILEEV